MSTITITVAEFEQLKALVEKLGGNVGKSGAVVAEAKPVKEKKEKKEKKPGAPRAWSDYTKLFTEACRAYNEGKPKEEKMLVPAFAAKYRKEHEEEWKAFEAKWKEEHPKSEAPSAAASEAGDSGSEAGEEAGEKKERKKRAPMSEEAKAAMKAKRAATVAAKKAKESGVEAAAKEEAAPAPVAAAPAAEPAEDDDSEEEVECELLPFKLAGEKYFRYGVLVNGKPQWRDGFLWENEKGVKGDFAGLLSADGKEIDTSVEEPEEE